jgi:hypothetical protein
MADGATDMGSSQDIGGFGHLMKDPDAYKEDW